MKNKPYLEKPAGENTVIRSFSKDVHQDELVWHRDAEDRIIEVLSGTGWSFQYDDSLPEVISEGDKMFVAAGEFHRLVKGDGDLRLRIIKEKKTRKTKKKKKQIDQNNDNKNDILDVTIAKMRASGMSLAQIRKERPDLFPNIKESSDDADKQMYVCPNCGSHNLKKNKKCIKCGFKGPSDDSGKIVSGWKLVKNESATLDEKKKRRRKRKKKSGDGLTPGYRSNRSTSDQSKLAALTKRYRDAKTPAEKKAARDARDRFEKTQHRSSTQSKHNYKKKNEETNMDMINLQIQILEELLDLNEKRKRKKRKSTKRKSTKRKSTKKKSGGSRKLSSKVDASLKKKAKDRNAPVGALKAIYRKGMGAFYSSGSRSGQNPHSWAMARVNSVLKGGKARSVDAAQWKQIQKFRQNKKKRK